MTTSNRIRRVAILGGNRIPFARSNTVYSHASNQEMLTAALQGLVDRYQLHGERLGDVVGGAVMKSSRDFNLVRESVLSTTLARETPAFDLQQACGTGLEAAIVVANKIALGQIECGIAGGVDTTSDAPIGLNEKMRRILLDASRARTTMQRISVLSRMRPGMLFSPALPRNGEPRTGLSMGEHAELMAREWGIRREEQDALALRSHHNLAKAAEEVYLVSPETAKLLALKQSILQETPDAKLFLAARADKDIAAMDMIVTATSGAGKKVLDIMQVKPGCVITDVARPLDLPAEEVAKRPDVLVIESGEILLPGDVQMKNIGLPKGVAYACLAETIVLALEGRFENFTVGRAIEWEKVREIYQLGLKHGMKLAAISGVNGPFSDEDIEIVREKALAAREIGLSKRPRAKRSQKA